MISEQEVSSKWRYFFKDGVTGDTLRAAKKLLNQLSRESRRRVRLSNELDEIRKLRQK